MPLTVLNHAVAAHLLAQLRDIATPPDRYRPITRSLTQILLVEGLRDAPTSAITVRTPLEETPGVEVAGGFVAVPVLRAGLGMLDATLDLLPNVTVGYVGLERNEETAVASSYYCKLPSLAGRNVLLLDPMLATGGSAAEAAQRLYDAGAERLTLLCVVAAPPGVALLTERFPSLHIVAAALDRELNARKYIVPGLGDFGDRLYGTF